MTSKIYFISDTHFGHTNIIKYCDRPFSDIKEMDQALIENWNAVVKPEDTIYHLGDVSWYGEETTKRIISQLHGHKHLIVGNHDKFKSMLAIGVWESVRDYSRLRVDKKTNLVMFHFPILSWDMAHHGAIHLHGHTHATIQPANEGTLRFDMGVDVWGFRPVSLEEVIEAGKEKLKQKQSEIQAKASGFDELYERAARDQDLSNLTVTEQKEM